MSYDKRKKDKITRHKANKAGKDEAAAAVTGSSERVELFDRTYKKLGEAHAHIHSGHRERMRLAALKDRRLDAFSDIELIELLLSFVIPQKDTNVTAHLLLDRFGSVLGVLKATPDELLAFPNMTAQAATLLPELIRIGIFSGYTNITLPSKQAAIELMDGVCFGGNNFGVFALFTDENGGLIRIERLTELKPRHIVASAISLNARRVLIVRRDDELFPTGFGLSHTVERVHTALTSVGAWLWDYIVFTDFGYYTVGRPPKTPGWFPLFMFLPSRKGDGTAAILRKTAPPEPTNNKKE